MLPAQVKVSTLVRFLTDRKCDTRSIVLVSQTTRYSKRSAHVILGLWKLILVAAKSNGSPNIFYLHLKVVSYVLFSGFKESPQF